MNTAMAGATPRTAATMASVATRRRWIEARISSYVARSSRSPLADTQTAPGPTMTLFRPGLGSKQAIRVGFSSQLTSSQSMSYGLPATHASPPPHSYRGGSSQPSMKTTDATIRLTRTPTHHVMTLTISCMPTQTARHDVRFQRYRT